jgi:NAD(P)-dependent dehydrogenase (short-subunit alcohol dehydrogenase family)
MQGQKVLIIGGSSGMGEEIARRCLAQGAQVCVASHTVDKLSAAQETLGSALSTELLDVAVESEVEVLLARLGPQDHVVFCAEAVARGAFVDVPVATARQNFEVKFWGTYYVARHMRINQGGSFTIFSGSISRMPFQRVVPVSIINSALETLTRGLAYELAPLRVNCISPGTIDTPAWLHISADARTALFERTRATLPLRRVGDAGDAAAAALMVMQNAFMTGVVLDVDGGAVLGNPPA